MANYASLISAVQAVIRENGNNEITGNILQQTLLSMINSLGVGYQFAGIATTDTNPGTPDQNVFYIAAEPGIYANFGSVELYAGEVAILSYNGAWVKNHTQVGANISVVYIAGSGTTAAAGGATNIGDVYLNTNSGLLRRRITSAGSFETVPWSRNAIYIQNDKLYLWDGENRFQVPQIRWNDALNRSNYLIGDNNTYVSKDIYGLVPGHTYRVYLKNPNWDTSGVTITGAYLFTLRSSYNGVQTNFYNINIGTTVNPYYDITIPDNSDYVRVGCRATKDEMVYYNFIDITGTGVVYDKEDALIIRAKTGSVSAADDPEGTRIRTVLQVKAGMKIWMITSDSGGLNCGVWNNRANAILAAAQGRLQNIVPGYQLGFHEGIISSDGWLGISLRNGTTAISDLRKTEMIDSLNFGVGNGTLYDISANYGYSLKNEYLIESAGSESYTNVYYGEKINLNNSFRFQRFANNSLGGQSAARYGNYLFIVTDNLTQVGCYNLQSKSLLYTLTTGLTPESTWHCNQSSFGKYFFDANDMFPILYISMRNDADGRCSALGFRIVPVLDSDGEITSFTISLAQTIKLPVMTDDNCLGNANVTFDLQENFMWAYSRNNRTGAENYMLAKFTKFAIPDLFDSDNNIISTVELNDADILDSFGDNWSMLNAQGGFIQNGKLVIMQGYPNVGYINCRVVDLYLSKKQTSFIDLYKAGFADEPEGVFFYDGKIMATGYATAIYQIDIA